MLPEDETRLRREADIARSVRGPDYSTLERSIAANKQALQKRTEAGNIEIARQRALSAASFYEWLSGALKSASHERSSRRAATRKAHLARGQLRTLL